MANPRKNDLRGSVLRPATSIGHEWATEIQELITRMAIVAKRELRQVFETAPLITQDAAPKSTTLAAQKAINALINKFVPQFESLAQKSASTWIKRLQKNSEVTFAMAVKEMAPDVTLSDIASGPLQEIVRASTHEAADLIKLIPRKFFSEVQGELMRSITTGNGLADLIPYLNTKYDQNYRHARLVALDQTRKAYASMTKHRMRSIGMEKFEWIHSGGGQHPRKQHQEWNGRIFDLDNLPIDKDFGPVLPGYAINCLPGDSYIERTEGLHKLMRRRFSGELTEIITESGEALKATANHPILTDRGWLSFGEVNVGDYVFHTADQCSETGIGNVQTAKTTIGELFNAARGVIPFGKTRANTDSSILEFHGDISDTEVEIIDIDGFLPDKFDSEICQRVLEFLLSVPLDGGFEMFSAESHAYSLIMRAFSAPDSLMRGAGKLLSFFGGQFTHSDSAGFRASSNWNAALDQYSPDNSSAYIELIGQFKLAQTGDVQGNDMLAGKFLALLGRALDSGDGESALTQVEGKMIRIALENSGDFLETLSLVKERHRVVEKRDCKEFTGHVYNLETCKGWYSTQGYIIHNCKCVLRPLISFEATE